MTLSSKDPSSQQTSSEIQESSETCLPKEHVWASFQKLEGSNLPVSDDNKLFKNQAIFDFESIWVPTEELKETQTTSWVGKHFPISVSISLILIDEHISLYNKDPQNSIFDFVTNLELLAEQKTLEIRKRFQIFEVADIERIKSMLDQLLERDKNYSSNEFGYED